MHFFDSLIKQLMFVQLLFFNDGLRPQLYPSTCRTAKRWAQRRIVVVGIKEFFLGFHVLFFFQLLFQPFGGFLFYYLFVFYVFLIDSLIHLFQFTISSIDQWFQLRYFITNFFLSLQFMIKLSVLCIPILPLQISNVLFSRFHILLFAIPRILNLI